MRDRLLRIALCITAVTLLSGCASNCNILSNSNSGACDAMLMGGMILAAPILAPTALFSDAASDAKSKRMARDWKSSMEARLADNDIEAIQECLHECDIRFRYELDSRVRGQLQRDAAQRFLAGDWHQLKPEESRAYQLLAHYTLSWQPQNTEDGARSVLMPDEVMRSYVLLADQAIHAPLKRRLRSTRYRGMIDTIYAMKFAVDTPINEAAAHARFKQCPDNMDAIMLDDESLIRRSTTCSRAYYYHFREHVPEELRMQWTKKAALGLALTGAGYRSASNRGSGRRTFARNASRAGF